MNVLIQNASEILTMKNGLGVLENTSILVENGTIKKIGTIKRSSAKKIINAAGCVVCPGLVDSHTHLVYGGSREEEFTLRITGVKYEKIAKSGGGIASSVKMTRRATEKELYESGQDRLRAIVRHGTTTVEIKSGYGLSTAEELKTLRVIRKLQKESMLDIVSTYLVHALPPNMKRRDYVDLVTKDIIPLVAEKKLAQFCDIFCDKIGFTRKESKEILLKAKEYGFKLKIHADQFANIRAAYLAAEVGCISADHLEYTTRRGIKAMKKSHVVPTLLPGATFFLQFKKKPRIAQFRKLKCYPAIASDYNPGSCMIYSMPKIIALACIIYGMHVEDALLGATKYSAKALDLFDRIGSIEIGKQADFVIFGVNNYKKIPYYFGEDIVKYTIKKGRVIYAEDS